MNECIRRFIEKLPENYGAAFVLSEIERLKNQEIAEILGTSPRTIKMHLRVPRPPSVVFRFISVQRIDNPCSPRQA